MQQIYIQQNIKIFARMSGIVLVGFFMYVSFAHAVSDQFTVTQQIGADTTSPTVPGNLTATPVAATQIDLSWDASTDDVGVEGYQVFRDATLIATSTQTTYQDTGRTPSTTYAYTLRAFDAEFNFSTATPTTTATTPAPTPTSTTSEESDEGGGGIRIAPAELTSLAIEAGTHDADFRWNTAVPTQAILKWGRTGSFELGSLKSGTYQRSHETSIDNLVPNTIYEYALTVISTRGQRVTQHGQFKTKIPPDVTPPFNVRNLSAQVRGEDIILRWSNPPNADFSHIRLLRNDAFYPNDTHNGTLVYEDDGESYRDTGAATADGIVYYTAFTYDEDGNVSSGAVVRAIVGDAVPEEQTQRTPTLDISLKDVDFIQDNVVLPIKGSEVHIDGDKELMMSVEYDLLPEHLKTILVTLTDPKRTNHTFSFLLRVNKAKSHYMATIAPLERSGRFELALNVFDFKHQEIARATGTLRATTSSKRTEATHDPDGVTALIVEPPFFFWLSLLLLLLIGYRLIRGYGVVQRQKL